MYDKRDNSVPEPLDASFRLDERHQYALNHLLELQAKLGDLRAYGDPMGICPVASPTSEEIRAQLSSAEFWNTLTFGLYPIPEFGRADLRDDSDRNLWDALAAKGFSPCIAVVPSRAERAEYKVPSDVPPTIYIGVRQRTAVNRGADLA